MPVHSLDEIGLEDCPNLTSNVLFTIADNCPDLQFLNFDYDDDKRTIRGLKKLLKCCPDLIQFSEDLIMTESFPVKIQEELNRREIANNN